MPVRQLQYVLTGTDQSASSAIGRVAEEGESTGERISGAFSKMSSVIGGEVGEIVNKVGEAFEQMGERGSSGFSKITGSAAALTGIGIALQTLSSGGKAAEQQLEASITATGGAYDDFSKQIDKAVSSEAQFGHGVADVDNALSALTQATQDPALALKDLNVVTDLAAYKHESLTDAATQLGKIYAGNTKLLKQFGIDMTVTAGDTDQANLAVTLLGQRLAGQASAQADTFTGHIQAVKTEIGDWGEKVANVVGGPLTYLSGALTVTSGIIDIFAARAERAAAAQLEEAASTETAVVAETHHGVTATTLTAAMVDLRIAEINASIAAEGLATSQEGVAVAEGEAAAAAEAEGVAQTLALGPIGLVLAAAVALGAAFDSTANKIGGWVDGNAAALNSIKSLTGSLSGLTSALHDDGDTFGDASKKWVNADIAQSGLLATFKNSKISLSDLTTAVGENDDMFNTTIESWRNSGQITNQQALALEALKGNYDQTLTAQTAVDEANAQLTNSTDAVGTATVAVTEDTKLLSSVMQGASSASTIFGNALKQVSGDAMSVEGNLNSLKDSLDGVSQSVISNGKSLDNNTAKGRANEESVLTAIKAAQQHATAVADQTGSIDKATAAYASDEAAIRSSAVAAGLNATQVQTLIDKYGGVPANVKTTITADTTQAFNSLQTLAGKLEYLGQLANTDVTDYLRLSKLVDPYAANTGGAAYDHASGGYVGGSTFDEAGNEALVLPGDTMVIPHGQTEQMLRGVSSGGGTTLNITLNIPAVVTPTPQIGQAIAQSLALHLGHAIN